MKSESRPSQGTGSLQDTSARRTPSIAPGTDKTCADTYQLTLEEIDERTDDWWKRTCQQGIRTLAATGRVFDAFALVEAGVPEPEHPSRWGAQFAAAHKAGVIVRAGAGPSSRPTVRGSVVRYWRGVV